MEFWKEKRLLFVRNVETCCKNVNYSSCGSSRVRPTNFTFSKATCSVVELRVTEHGGNRRGDLFFFSFLFFLSLESLDGLNKEQSEFSLVRNLANDPRLTSITTGDLCTASTESWVRKADESAEWRRDPRFQRAPPWINEGTNASAPRARYCDHIKNPRSSGRKWVSSSGLSETSRSKQLCPCSKWIVYVFWSLIFPIFILSGCLFRLGVASEKLYFIFLTYFCAYDHFQTHYTILYRASCRYIQWRKNCHYLLHLWILLMLNRIGR